MDTRSFVHRSGTKSGSGHGHVRAGQKPDSPEESILAIECAHPRCGKRTQDRYKFPIPLCRAHLVAVLVSANEVITQARNDFADQNLGRKPTAQGMLTRNEPLVYYIRFGDRVKIGTTTNMKRRLDSVPHDEILATEPGGREVEHARHVQFRADNIKGEWFRFSDQLAQHIRTIA